MTDYLRTDPLKDIIAEIKQNIASDSAESILLPGSEENAGIDLSCFRQIRSPKIAGTGDKSRKIAFIDGGDAELLSAPDFCVHFMRIYYTIYLDNRRVKSATDEFYVLVTSKSRDVGGKNRIMYSAKLFRSDAKTLPESFYASVFDFDSLDRSLCTRNTRADISVIPGIIRRLAELSTALVLTGSLEQDSVIVVDGDLESRTGDEQKLLSALQQNAQKSGITVAGVSKTSAVLTSSGSSAASTVAALAPDSAWYYQVKGSAGEEQALPILFFAKLHQRSDYIFKLESFGPAATEDLFALLAMNSADPIFLGYPYGLIDADRFARISNKELEYQRTMFATKAGRDWRQIDRSVRSKDAHSVLDSVSW
ncbi:DNA double-strand break repair nuclease NurA [Candidatus Woesearchaeota archaeon]|nr:DNA double-strand break repair nuclease NurA [Candidatus Woesearchaeota archaeon]